MENQKARTVKVTMVGYFEIKAEDLKSAYEADSFEEALVNQRRWLADGMVDIQELVDDADTVTLEFTD